MARTRVDRTPLAAALGVLSLSLLFSANQIWDSDSWLHLASGRLILARGIPSTNTFSSVFPDFPTSDPEWLFQVVSYLAALPAGPGGTVLLQMALVGSAVLLAAGTFLRGAGRVGRAELLVLFPVLLLALGEIRLRCVLRPHLVTFLGIALLLHLWSARPKRMPLWFALAGAVWANAHPGVVFGALLCGLFVASTALARDRAGVRAGSIAGAAFLAGSLANPYLLYPYLYSFTHLVGLGADLPNIAEFLPPSLAHHPAFFLLAFLALVAVPFRIRKGDWLHPLAAGVFFALAFRAQREASLFCLVALPGTLLGLRQAVGARTFSRAGGLPLWAASLLVGGLALFLSWKGWADNRGWLRPGIGIYRAVTPEGAVRFMLEKGFTGRFYNDMGNGGYLIWRLFPRQGVLQDGRLLAYPAGFLREVQGVPSSPDPAAMAKVADRYRLEGAVITRGLYDYFDLYVPLFQEMGWNLVHLDGVSCVFVRPGSPDAQRAAGSEFTLVRPGMDPEGLFLLGQRWPERMRREVGRIAPESLLGGKDCLGFAMAAWGAGDFPLAGAFLRRGREIDPSSPLWSENLERLPGGTR